MAETTKTNVEYLDKIGLSLFHNLNKAYIANAINDNKYNDTALKLKVNANEPL